MIRPASPEDAPAIAALNRLARATAMPWLPVLHTLDGDVRFFTRLITEQRVEVAEIQGVLHGFCSLQGGWIDQLYIHPDHQRQGLGSAFMARAKAGAETLQLWVFAQNQAAQDFYAAHGFLVVEQADGRNNEEKCPDCRMIWTRAAP